MRDAFANELTKIAGEDERIVLLSGDIGNRLFDDFKSRFPKRFFNCGVAEANMMSMAAGMALSGLRPVAYTITPFITTRCLEQIRVDVCYHNVPVTIVGVGAGLSYASLNATHHSCEDIAFLRALPNMTIVCPADPIEVKCALSASIRQNGPLYLRLGKKGEPVIHSRPPQFEIGKAIVVRSGTEVCILSAGTIMPVALEAAKMLETRGISTQVVSFHTVKPLDERTLADSFSRFSVVATIEEHSIVGGFGGAVAEWLSERPPQKARLQRIGTADRFMYEAGEQEHAREFFGLTAEATAERVTLALERALMSSPK
jgi:transketolase